MSLLGRATGIHLCESKPDMKPGFGLWATPLRPTLGSVQCYHASLCHCPAHHRLPRAGAEPPCSQGCQKPPCTGRGRCSVRAWRRGTGDSASLQGSAGQCHGGDASPGSQRDTPKHGRLGQSCQKQPYQSPLEKHAAGWLLPHMAPAPVTRTELMLSSYWGRAAASDHYWGWQVTHPLLCWYFFSPGKTETSGTLILCRFSAHNKRVGLRKLKTNKTKKKKKKKKKKRKKK